MTTCASLSKQWCSHCSPKFLPPREVVYDKGACMHCGASRYGAPPKLRSRSRKDFVDGIYPERHTKPTPAHIARRPKQNRVPPPGNAQSRQIRAGAKSNRGPDLYGLSRRGR